MKTFYHFTTKNRLRSIKRYGLCIGDTVISDRKGINAVNLTEESHFHDPSLNNLTSGIDAIYRITVRLSLNDMRLRSMESMYKVYPKMRRFHKVTHSGSTRGNAKRHWIYEGQITPDKFVAVHEWNGREFEEVNLASLKDLPNCGEGEVLNTRLLGLYLYDESGVAEEVMKHNFFQQPAYKYTDCINEILHASFGKEKKGWFEENPNRRKKRKDYESLFSEHHSEWIPAVSDSFVERNQMDVARKLSELPMVGYAYCVDKGLTKDRDIFRSDKFKKLEVLLSRGMSNFEGFRQSVLSPYGLNLPVAA